MKRSVGITFADKTRIAAGILALAVFFCVLLSVSFIAHEANHDCTGEDCPVCALIQLCEDGLRQLGSGIAVAAAAIITFFVLIQILSAHNSDDIVFSTPVSRKTRLNN